MEFSQVVPVILSVISLLVFALLTKSALGIVIIRESELGLVVKKLSLDSRKLAQGRIIALQGEPGYQARTLAPGLYFWFWPWMYSVEKSPVTVIPTGKIGLVNATDGAAPSTDRVLCRAVPCNNFQDAEAFLTQGGQKGKQSAVLMSGTYRINPALFKIQLADVTTIESDKVGILTTTDGHPLTPGIMAAPVISGHSDFQNPDQFYELGGQRGLQEQVLLAGQYNLNPWFVTVEQRDLTTVPIGHVGVVVSFVGEDKPDISGESFTHGNIVPRGGRGVWSEPLHPGKHPINTRTMKVELVPTTNIVLNWANARSEAHRLDEKLSTITVRSQDGFTFNLDVSQIINIGAKEAPFVISRVGSVNNLVNQVLEPIIGNYFRNSSQSFTVLDFLKDRAQRQQEAAQAIRSAIGQYNVESVDTLIGDITPPAELMKPLTDRKVAEEQRITFTTQKAAQQTRQELVAATALADKQTELVNEEQNILIAKRRALASVEQAQGDAQATRTRGEAEADISAIRGEKDAQAIQAMGLARAASAKAGVEAMGENFALVQIFQHLAENQVKLVPDVVSSSDAGGNGALLGMVVSMLQRQKSE